MALALSAASPVPTPDHSQPALHRLIEQAKRNLADGDITAARLRLTPAARADIPEALRLMGQTYDPRWLLAHGAASVRFDEVLAVQFYMAARALGDEDARRILEPER